MAPHFVEDFYESMGLEDDSILQWWLGWESLYPLRTLEMFPSSTQDRIYSSWLMNLGDPSFSLPWLFWWALSLIIINSIYLAPNPNFSS
jgi:hypothetical protein